MLLNIQKKSLEKTMKEIERIKKDSFLGDEMEFEFTSFKANNKTFKLAVIDGSNYTMKGMNCILTFLRTGVQYYQNDKIFFENIDPVVIELITNNKDRELGFQMKHEEYYANLTGELPNYTPEFDKVVEKIRTLMEWGKVQEAIEKLSKGDVVLFDGSLISGAITTNHNFYKELVAKSKKKGICLAGLSKDSHLSIQSSPVSLVLHRAAKRQYDNKNWYTKYKDNYFVRFSKLKDYIFRLDAVLPDEMKMDDLLPMLSSYAYAYGVQGYLYPMMKIHQSVLIKRDEAKYCFDILRRFSEKNKQDMSLFDKIFSIYHDELDRISYGR